ncbi:AGE family epimerase/isomerase [Rhizobium sp. LEGMi12c]
MSSTNQTAMKNYASLLHFKSYFIEIVLPTWISSAFDDVTGQFMEGLQIDGSADPSGIVRTRTAARVVYVFAHATALGVAPQGSLQKAERAFANLSATSRIGTQTQGFPRSISYRTGAIVDSERDLYDHACVLLALTWLAQATGKATYRNQIDDTITAMDDMLTAPHGGWAEDSLGTIPRRQNPHMHCFESFLALAEAYAAPAHIARASELYGLFRSRFFDEATNTLREYFGPAWEIGDIYGSGRIEPGHMAEWVWLIGRYVKWSGRDLSSLTAKILDNTLSVGRQAGTPFLIDETSVDGIPTKQSRRLWPQAELIKAYITQARLTGNSDYLEHAEQLTAALLETYLAHTPRGTWRDCFDLGGRSIATSIPASSLYHLWTVVCELIQLDRR